jgi:hypothetical protein
MYTHNTHNTQRTHSNSSVWHLTPSPSPVSTLSVTFKMYDVDGDGFISNADLFHVLKAMVMNERILTDAADRHGL